MIRREQRPFTAEERAQLAGEAARGARWVDRLRHALALHAGCASAGFLAWGMIALVLALIGFDAAHPFLLLLLLVLTVGGFLWGGAVFRDAEAGARRRREDACAALAAGQAEVLEAEARDAVAVEPLVDEGPGYFLDVDEGRLLFLQGPYLADLVDAGAFPSRRLRLTRAAGTGLHLAFECLGEPLRPSRSREFLEHDEYWPSDSEIVPARLSTLEADLRRLAGDRRG
jgi:hypothetical protein